MSNLKEKEIAVLEEIKDNKGLQFYFFSKINDIKWFEPLKEKGFFEENNIPYANFMEENINFEPWFILDYVNKVVTKLINNNKNDEVKFILEDIIIKITEKESKNFKLISQLIEIFSKIPTNCYDEKTFVKLINKWCDFGEYQFILVDNLVDNLLVKLLEENSSLTNLLLDKVLSVQDENYNDIDIYKLYEILINEHNIHNLLQINFKESIKIFANKIQNILFYKESIKIFNDKEIRIKQSEKKFKVLIDGKFELSFKKSSRFNEIDNLVHSIKNKVFVNEENIELENTLENLYLNLFTKESSQSIFHIFNKGYINNEKLILLSKLIKILIDKAIEYSINKEEIYNVLFYMMDDRYIYLNKLAIYIIVKNKNNFQKCIHKFINEKEETFKFFITDYVYAHELKNLFECIDNLNDKEIEFIDEVIENKGEYLKYNKNEIQIQIWKQSRYKALRHILYFNEKYQKLKQKTNTDYDLSPALYIGGLKNVQDKTPLTLDDILTMSIEKIVDYTKNELKSNECIEESKRGLAKIIEDAVFINPFKFYDSFEQTFKLEYIFLNSVIRGIKRYYIEKYDKNDVKKIDYKSILFKLYVYIEKSNADFWDLNSKGYNKVLIKSIMEFINIFLLDDKKYDYDTEISNKIIDIIYLFINKMDMKYKDEILFSNNDLISYNINSVTGVITKIIIYLALKNKRINLEDNENIWKEKLEKIYEKLLSIQCMDAYIDLGRHINNFIYLDKTWINEKIEKYKNINNDMKKYFIVGYISSRDVYLDLYEKMKEYYIYAIKNMHNFNDKHLKEYISTHVMIGYLNGLEDKHEKQIINMLYNVWDVELITKCIYFCSNSNKDEFILEDNKNNVCYKIKEFWNEIVKHYKQYSHENFKAEDRKLIAASNKFLKFFDVVEKDILENLEFVIEKSKNYLVYYHIIKYFKDQVGKSFDEEILIKYAEVFIILVKNYFPSYPKEDIFKIISYVYNNEETRSFANIAIKEYLKRGYSFGIEIDNYIKMLNSNKK